MNSRQVECILEVAKTQNFNRAAENLFISQPTLSHHIKVVEEELGFKIFDRSQKSVQLTNVGKTFCQGLETINDDLQTLIEQCQNFGQKYQRTIKISIFNRLALLKLPKAIEIFKSKYPKVFIDPIFDSSTNRFGQFLAGQTDILFIRDEDAKNVKQIKTYPLYDSRIKLVVASDDTLSNKRLVKAQDLANKTLLVGGGSSTSLKKLQKNLVKDYKLATINSHDHNTTLTQVASKTAICLSPDLYEDNNPEIKWLDFEPKINIPCYLATSNNASKEVIDFVKILQNLYQNDGK